MVENSIIEWRDLLGRRIQSRAEHSGALALAPDGRIALCAGAGVSVLYCRAAVLATLAASEAEAPSLQELFDDVQRKARGVRAPAVAHIPVDKHPSRSLAWAEPPVLLSAPTSSDSPMRRIAPATRLGPDAPPEGCWGLESEASIVIVNSEIGRSPHVKSTLKRGARHRRCAECSAKDAERETTMSQKCNSSNRSQTEARRSSPRMPRRKLDLDFELDVNGGEGIMQRKKMKREDDAEYAPDNNAVIHEAIDELSDDESFSIEEDISGGQTACVHVAESKLKTNWLCDTDIESQAICLRYFRLCATDIDGNSQIDSECTVNSSPFVLIGSRENALIHQWCSSSASLTGTWQLNDQWTSTVEVAEAVDLANSPMARIAVGGPFGRVRVFGVTWLPFDDGSDDLKITPLWNGADEILRGPVTSFAFDDYTRDRTEWHLLIGVGTSIAGVRFSDGKQKSKRQKTQISLQQNAHYQSVVYVNFLPDFSVISAARDDSILRWDLSWESDKEPCTLIGVIRKESKDLDSIIAARPSPSGLLTVVMSSRPLVKGEIGETSIAVKKKYHYLARSTLLSILAYPMTRDREELKVCFHSILTKLVDLGRYADLCLTLWDVELWLLASTEYMDYGVGVLCEHFAFVLSQAENESSQLVAIRLRKIALCIATTLERIVPNYRMRLPQEHKAQLRLRLSVLSAYHFDTLLRFARTIDDETAKSVTETQQEALEAKFTFVTAQCTTLGGDKEYMDSSLAEIGRKLNLHFPNASSFRSQSMCTVCETLPLVADADEPESFWCANGEYFSRCVKTSLACTDCVPRVCNGCGSKARCEDMDVDAHPWELNIWCCPLCNCELVYGRAERQLEFFDKFSADVTVNEVKRQMV